MSTTPTIPQAPVNEYLASAVKYINTLAFNYAQALQAAQSDIAQGNHVAAVNDLVAGAAESVAALAPSEAGNVAAGFQALLEGEALVTSLVGVVRALFHHSAPQPAAPSAQSPTSGPAVSGAN